MRRGGRRPRQMRTHDLAVYCPGGRWGPRRTRVTECYAVIKAEDVYTAIFEQKGVAPRTGARGSATSTFPDSQVTFDWETRHNAIWRLGRVFLRCSRCAERCTRLYLPLKHSRPACRRCWGLTYASRTLHNYKDSLWGRGPIARMFSTTQREWAYLATHEKRQDWRRDSRLRRAKRRSVAVTLRT